MTKICPTSSFSTTVPSQFRQVFLETLFWTYNSQNEFDVRQKDPHDEGDKDDDDGDHVETERGNEVGDHVGVSAATLKPIKTLLRPILQSFPS
jgi:hypothetical protein